MKVDGRELKGGAISWMARNPVASNLLMTVLLLGGLIIGSRVKQEVFPEFTIDTVQVRVPYPGASPEEVEEGILLAVEEGVRGVDGVKKVTSNAFEGSGTVRVELTLGTDPDKALQDCKLAVDRITTFPRNAERPTVSLLSNRREVISLVVYGDQGERQLRDLAERVRMDLTRHPDVTLVELDGIRPLEIGIEVPQDILRAHGLTLEGVAASLSRSSLDLPGGGVKAQGGEVLLRLAERRDRGGEFADIPVVSRPDGTWIRLDEIARIRDGFADTDQATYFNGKPAVRIIVFRVGDQGPLEVAAAVKEYIAEFRKDLPVGVGISVWEDWSDIYRQRINLLLRNAGLGLILVLLILGLFLDRKSVV